MNSRVINEVVLGGLLAFLSDGVFAVLLVSAVLMAATAVSGEHHSLAIVGKLLCFWIK